MEEKIKEWFRQWQQQYATLVRQSENGLLSEREQYKHEAESCKMTIAKAFCQGDYPDDSMMEILGYTYEQSGDVELFEKLLNGEAIR